MRSRCNWIASCHGVEAYQTKNQKPGRQWSGEGMEGSEAKNGLGEKKKIAWYQSKKNPGPVAWTKNQNQMAQTPWAGTARATHHAEVDQIGAYLCSFARAIFQRVALSCSGCSLH